MVNVVHSCIFLDFNDWAIKDGIAWAYLDERHVPAEYRALTLLL